MFKPNVSALLKKTTHYDKDERYMATPDLCQVLKRSSAAVSGDVGEGPNSIVSIVLRNVKAARPVLRLLHDKSKDVKAVTAKTFGAIMTTAQCTTRTSLQNWQFNRRSRTRCGQIGTPGCLLHWSPDSCQRLSNSMGHAVSQSLLGRILDGIRHAINKEIVLACLDVMNDLLARFGAMAVSVTRGHDIVL